MLCSGCGAPLDEADLLRGSCPVCGHPINARIDGAPAQPQATGPTPVAGPIPPPLVADVPDTTGTTPDAVTQAADPAWFPSAFDEKENLGPTVPFEARLTPEERIDIARTEARLAAIGPATPVSLSFVGLLAGLGVALLLIVACSATVLAIIRPAAKTSTLVTKSNPPIHVTGTAQTSDSGLGFATQAPNPTSLPYNYDTPTLEPSPTPLITPTPTATPIPTATTPGQGGGGTLIVTPPIILTNCNSGSGEITIANIGSGSMSWVIQADAAVGYNFNPESSGTLDAGKSKKITVSNIKQSGSVTIVADGAQGSPQSVAIGCG